MITHQVLVYISLTQSKLCYVMLVYYHGKLALCRIKVGVVHLFRTSACESCGTSSKAYHDKFNHHAPRFVEPDGWKVHTQE